MRASNSPISNMSKENKSNQILGYADDIDVIGRTKLDVESEKVASSYGLMGSEITSNNDITVEVKRRIVLANRCLNRKTLRRKRFKKKGGGCEIAYTEEKESGEKVLREHKPSAESKNKNGDLITDKEEILMQWENFFKELLIGNESRKEISTR
uniref:Uncharacterized protein n=1 Tax=Megaselia scalaris TaxID=36166 RepID=T1GJB0_MEGSC